MFKKKKTGNSLTVDVGKMYVHTHTSESSYLRSGQVEDQSIMVMELGGYWNPTGMFHMEILHLSRGVGRI